MGIVFALFLGFGFIYLLRFTWVGMDESVIREDLKTARKVISVLAQTLLTALSFAFGGPAVSLPPSDERRCGNCGSQKVGPDNLLGFSWLSIGGSRYRCTACRYEWND